MVYPPRNEQMSEQNFISFLTQRGYLGVTDFELQLKTEALSIRYLAPKIINIEEISHSETHGRHSYYLSKMCGK